jgi:hypothetical protein
MSFKGGEKKKKPTNDEWWVRPGVSLSLPHGKTSRPTPLFPPPKKKKKEKEVEESLLSG